MIAAPAIKYELSEKQQAISCGGIGVIMQLAEQLKLRKEINQAIPLLKLHLPYDEADHVLNIALNLLAGGSCLDHLEQHAWGITTWYDHPISTGPLEGTNNKIKTMQRQHYGLRDAHFRKLKIYALHETKYALVG